MSALSPYRILDLTDDKGFLCGKMLGDLGADVIKIERCGGDPARNIGPFYQDDPHPEKSLYWFVQNTSKRGITLNLHTADGREVFRRLAERADVLVDTFRPGYLDELGIGYETLEGINPRLIMTSITPFGQTGPYKDYKGSDITAMAMGGLMSIIGDPDRAPLRARAAQSHFCAAVVAALATLAAIHYRDATGEGQFIDVSMQEAMTWFVVPTLQNWDLERIVIRRSGPGRQFRDRVRRVIFPCKDGYVAIMGVLGREWPALVEWLDAEGMAGELKDPKWAELAQKIATREIPYADEDDVAYVNERLIPFLMSHKKAELYDEGQKRRIIIFPLNTPKDLVENVQLNARNFFVEVDHPELGEKIKYPGASYVFSETPWQIQRRAPLIGEHNLEIYEGELGYTRPQLAVLKASGAI